MAILGFGDLRELQPPALWDLAEMRRIAMADGTTFDQVLTDARDGLQLLNGSLLSMPHYSSLFSVQDNVEVEYPVGVVNGYEDATEYGTPSPQRGKVTGHSLPIKAYDRGMGWTMMYLRNGNARRIDADIRSVVTDSRSLFQLKLLQRFFKSTAENVGATTGASVPFADGGTADANYVPPVAANGKTFLSTHNHYLRVDTIANAVAPAILTLSEHGHTAPFDIIASEADNATWAGLSKFKAPMWSEVAYMASTTERAQIPDVGTYIGFLETTYGIARIWSTPRLPTNYFGVFKDYGPGDSRAPMRMRINPNTGFGFQLVPGNWVNAPTLMAVSYAEFGVGIGEDRTNGVAVYLNAGGNYTDPTIS